MEQLKVYSQCYDGTDGLFYLKSEADKLIADLEESHKKEVGRLQRYHDDEATKWLAENQKLKEKIDSIKVEFRKFNDNVCRKIVDVSRTISAISQDALMDFYEEFIKEAK